MQTTPLARQGEKLRGYRGGEIAATDRAGLPDRSWPREQLLLYDASWRAVLAVAGPEARKWLNGMITTNVKELAPGACAPGFQLDPKGHVLASLDVVCVAPEEFLLLTDEAQREGLEQRLRRFVFIAKLTMEDRSAAWAGLRLRGRRAVEVAAEAGWSAPEAQHALATAPAGWTLASLPGGVMQLEYAGPAEAVRGLWEKLQERASPGGADAQEQDRIWSRQPLYGVDITEAELAQETGQTDHLSFTKGCYIGQEIVERIRARGAVHRQWRAFQFDGAVAPGAVVEVEGRAAGKLTSVADGFALGYLREAGPGAEVKAAGVSGRVLEEANRSS